MSRTSTPPPAAVTTTSRAGSCGAGRCYTLGAVHRIPAGVAPESSGIVASVKSPGVYFVVDDGTGVDQIQALRSDGSLVGAVAVSGMSAENAEAMAAGSCGEVAGKCFYIGDIGDNGLKRDHITVYRLAEPSLSPLPSGPVAADAWDYRYPDGPHNAEAMVVATDGSVLVITKSTPNPTTEVVPPHRIYRGAPGGGELRLVSSFTPQSPARRVQSLFTGTVVTDASYTPGRMLLLTYDEVIEYVAPTAQADPATFPSWPRRELPNPPMIQSEGITADVSGCGYEVTSEAGPGGGQAGLAGVNCHPE